MSYYMDHAEHGAHVCYTLEDVETHKKAGWVLREEKASSPEFSGHITMPAEKKKPGRKPKVK